MALLPPKYIKSIVSIEVEDGNDTRSIGTGFLFFKTLEQVNEKEHRGKSFLVTARHVIEKQLKRGENNLFLRFDSLGDEEAKAFQIPLYDPSGRCVFSSSVNSDVSVAQLDTEQLEKENIDFIHIIGSSTALSPTEFSFTGLATGDEVFFLGFPLGIRGNAKNYAICRGGIIARLDSEALSKKIIYLDAPVFPGNSGGPVFCKPQIAHIDGTKALDKAYLIGVVTTYIAKDEEVDTGLSEDQVRSLEGYLGLSKIVTVDAIYDAISVHESRFGLSTIQ